MCCKEVLIGVDGSHCQINRFKDPAIALINSGELLNEAHGHAG